MLDPLGFQFSVIETVGGLCYHSFIELWLLHDFITFVLINYSNVGVTNLGWGYLMVIRLRFFLRVKFNIFLWDYKVPYSACHAVDLWLIIR